MPRTHPSLGRYLPLLLMLLPYLLGVALLVLLPAALAFGLAFFRYSGLSAPVWAGTANFTLAFTDELFGLSVQNSLALTMAAVPLRVGAALLAALLLRRGGAGLAGLRALVFLPSLIPTAAWAVAWLWVLNPRYGPLNLLLAALGISPPAWLADPAWAKPGLALMSLWQIGEGFLICLAALHSLPRDIEDAALVDGATSWQRLLLITLPLCAPWLLLLAVRDIAVLAHESFISIGLTTGGGPYYATYTLPLFIYEQAFDLLAFGPAAAALWALYGLTAALFLAALGLFALFGVELTDDQSIL